MDLLFRQVPMFDASTCIYPGKLFPRGFLWRLPKQYLLWERSIASPDPFLFF
jgi:hypothetical protein